MSVMLTNSTNTYAWQDRPPTDFYPTPWEVTRALVDFFQWPTEETIWEPAAGAGHMAETLRNNGYKVRTTDIQTGDDFLLQTECPESLIITNPPFIIAEHFIRQAAKLGPKLGFALLLKSQYWHSSKRLKLFQAYPPSFVLPLTWRPDFLFGAKSASPTMEVLWTVWQPNKYRTIYEPLPRPFTTL